MRGVLAAVAGLVLAFPGGAPAAAPIGAPGKVRVSRPADERPHPAARTEVWEMMAVEPSSRRTVTVRLRRAQDLTGVDVLVAGGRAPARSEQLVQRFQAATGPLVRFAGDDGSTVVDRHRGVVGVRLDGRVTGRLWLRRARPGALATGWRLGEALRYPAGRYEPVGLSWNVPVATSRLEGWIRVGGERISLNGWRASFEHFWGSLDLRDDAWEYWDAYTVHDRRGAWLAFGLNRRDTVTGPGARDAQWLGVLVRATGRRTRACRPSVRRRGWTYALGEWPHATRLRARCRRVGVALHDLRDPQLLRHDSHIGHFEYADHATSSRGGLGIGRHRGHPYG